MPDLSLGNQKKLSLILALAHNAKCLLLDEPSTGLDSYSREFVVDYLASFDGALILISHDAVFTDNAVIVIGRFVYVAMFGVARLCRLDCGFSTTAGFAHRHWRYSVGALLLYPSFAVDCGCFGLIVGARSTLRLNSKSGGNSFHGDKFQPTSPLYLPNSVQYRQTKSRSHLDEDSEIGE